MQKIEKWRVQELALVFSELADLLKKGNNCEWANVFSHYYDESQKIITKKEFDLDLLNKLIQNTKNCFSVGNSFLNIVLWHQNPEERAKINQDFQLNKALLIKILSDMEQRVIEHIN